MTFTEFHGGPLAGAAKAADSRRDELVDSDFALYPTKPGIAGRTQINGRREDAAAPDKIPSRVSHDLRQTENRSVQFDPRTLTLTPPLLLEAANAC